MDVSVRWICCRYTSTFKRFSAGHIGWIHPPTLLETTDLFGEKYENSDLTERNLNINSYA